MRQSWQRILLYKITGTLLSLVSSCLAEKEKKRHKEYFLLSMYLFKVVFFPLVLCGLKMLEGEKEKVVDKNVKM